MARTYNVNLTDSGTGGGKKNKNNANAKNDNSLAAQIAKDKAAMEERKNKGTTPTTNTYKPSVNSGTTEDVVSKNSMIQQYEELKKGISDIGAKLLATFANVANTIEKLHNGYIGKATQSIDGEIGEGLESINTVIDKLNSINERASEKIKQIDNSGMSISKNIAHGTSPKLKNKSGDTLYCDTNKLRGEVEPSLNKSCNELEEISAIASELPKLEGCEEIKQIVSQVDDLKKIFSKVYDKIEGLVQNVEGTEKKNQQVIDALVNASMIDMPKISDTANVANAGLGFLKGLGNVGESLFDAAVILTTTVADSGTMTTGEFVPYQEGNRGITEETWKDVMGFVADDHVENAYKEFYENTDAGKWLDDNASEVFKSGGTVTKIASGLGEVVGIAGLTLVTGGGTAASAAIAGTAGIGKYTEEYWGNAKDNAKEGEEWATEEVRNKGIIYGVASGAWEAAQWGVGGSLNDLTIKGASSAVTSAVRVGIDTGFNALDTPFRAVIDAVTSDKTVKEAFEDRGGWKTVATDVAIGLVGSVGGEVLDGKWKNENEYKISKELERTGALVEDFSIQKALAGIPASVVGTLNKLFKKDLIDNVNLKEKALSRRIITFYFGRGR